MTHAFRLFSICLAAIFVANPSLARVCGLVNTSVIQIHIGELDSGDTTTTAFRLTEKNQLSLGRWTSENTLLGQSATVEMPEDSFKTALALANQIASDASASKGAAPSTPVLGFEPGYSAEIVIRSESNRATTTLIGSPTDELDALLKLWSDAAPITKPKAGRYLWTLPASPSVRVTDIILYRDRCAPGGDGSIAQAMMGPDLLVEAPTSFSEFTTGTNAGRSRFVARIPNGAAYFGVVKSN